jgi:hypothetical protein
MPVGASSNGGFGHAERVFTLRGTMLERDPASSRAPVPPVPVGACFGFEVKTDLSLTYLRNAGRTDGQLAVREDEVEPVSEAVAPLREWEPTDVNPFHARLYAAREDIADRLWVRDLGWYAVDATTGEIVIPAGADPIRREERLWGIPATLCFLARGDVPLHAAAVDVGGRALLFGAPGRHGKTTLAAAFHAAGHGLLSEDVACLRVAPEPLVVPGPAMLRVRPDSFSHVDLPETREVGRDPDRVHLALERSAGADPVGLAGVVLLRGTADSIDIQPENRVEVVRDLWALSFKVPTDADRVRCFQALVDLAAAVPVWGLRRPMTFDALPSVVDSVIERCVA